MGDDLFSYLSTIVLHKYVFIRLSCWRAYAHILRLEKDFFGKEIRLGAALGKKVEFFESDWLESDHKISFDSKENEGNPAPNDLQRLCFSYRLCFGFNRLLLKRLFRF